MDTISFKRHRFPPEIIRRAIWLYARFTLSYRDVEDLLAERGVDISYESVRRWLLKFGAPIAQNLRHMRPIPNGYWHLDEMVIVIRGQRYWLWRAIDNGGEVLDFLVQSKRNAKAALKLMRKLLKKQGWTPTRITTDKLRSYHVAIRTLGLTAQHIDNGVESGRGRNPTLRVCPMPFDDVGDGIFADAEVAGDPTIALPAVDGMEHLRGEPV